MGKKSTTVGKCIQLDGFWVRETEQVKQELQERVEEAAIVSLLELVHVHQAMKSNEGSNINDIPPTEECVREVLTM